MGDKIKKSVKTIVGINPKFNKDISEKIIKIENLSTEVEIPAKSYTYDHLKKKAGGIVMKSERRMKSNKKAIKGKKFPDLSGDGKVTQKDILMGRGVIKKKAGGIVRGTARGMGAATKGGGYNVEPN